MKSFQLSTIFLVAIFALSEQNKDILENEEAEQEEWWQSASFYQIYVKSFKDSNKDGIGDLKGITSKLDYIESLGVQAIWLSPIFVTKQFDDDNDVSDFYNIQPDFGTLDDFKELVQKAHKKGLKVIIDFIPNHTSMQHEWFTKAQADKDNEEYGNFYVWAGSTNNWLSKDSTSAWTYDRKRGQNYYHVYQKEEPDLNYRNTAVKEEINKILEFWLTEYEVDGFKMRDVSYLVEDEKFTDEVKLNETDTSYDNLIHSYTKDHEENYNIVYDWRVLLDNISSETNVTRVLFAEADTTLASQIKYYGSTNGNTQGAHLTTNKHLLTAYKTSKASDLADLISEWIKQLPSAYRFNWMLGQYSTSRVASRVTSSMVDGYNILTGLLPGIQITYNGEEIGMEDSDATCVKGENEKDYEACLSNLKLYTSPFQWSNTDNAGFTEKGVTPWTTVSGKYKTCNVEDQSKDETSHLNIYRKLQTIRATTRYYENFELGTVGEKETVLRLVRSHLAEKNVYDVFEFFFNLEGTEVEVNLNDKWRKSANATVVLSSNSDRNISDIIYYDEVLKLKPYEAIILEEIKIKTSSATILKVFGFSNLFVLIIVIFFN